LAGILDIDQVTEPIFDPGIMKTLVMDDKNKKLIQSICYQFTRRGGPLAGYAADFVSGKGTGRVFLLHGPPGVGKTLTAGKSFHPHCVVVR
jgi:DNA polymerase III delta prime subunit